jgi:hypothetical protein
MKYNLRNPEKIAKVLSEGVLLRILSSLGTAFKYDKLDERKSSPHNLLFIDDSCEASGYVVFHIIRKYRDTYFLAFKEFIN